MATPFDTVPKPGPNMVEAWDSKTQQMMWAERLTPGQRKTLREMMLEKAELRGMDLEQADDVLDEWFKDMTKVDAARHIKDTGKWLDRERARRGIRRTR